MKWILIVMILTSRGMDTQVFPGYSSEAICQIQGDTLKRGQLEKGHGWPQVDYMCMVQQ